MKVAWLGTHIRLDDSALQLIMAKKISILVARLVDSNKNKSAYKDVEKGDSEVDPDAEFDEGGRADCAAARHPPRAPRSRLVSAARLVRESGVATLPAVFGVTRETEPTTCGSVLIGCNSQHYESRTRVVRAKKNFYGHAHFCWVKYITRRGNERIGRVCVMLTGVGGQVRHVFILERGDNASPGRTCQLTAYGCQRLQWVTCASESGSTPVLEVVPHSAITAVLCVELNWADRVLRYSLATVP